MVKKWTLAAIAYLLLVMGSYGIYALTVNPEETPSHTEEMDH
ncbi:hypothetical protein [Bacillus sp. FJAT-27251]|nr:hypothetical protein [Bacillus sp. FJAT-27251]